MNRATAVALAAAAVTLGSAPLAHAYPNPPAGQAQASVSPSVIQPGDCTTLTGSGLAPDSLVTVTDNGAPLPDAHADHDGNVSQQICLGDDATPGNHIIKITGPAEVASVLRRASLRTQKASLAADTISAQVVLVVSGPHSLPRTDDSTPTDASVGSGSGGHLAFTGFPAVGAVVLGAGLVGGGALVVRAGRRRTA